MDVLEHLGRDHPVELAVGEGQRQRVALLDVGLGAGGHLAGLLHRAEELEHAGELVGVHVEGHHVGAAAVHLEGVAAGAAAHVEHPVAGLQAEAVEVDGEHQAVSFVVWKSAITDSYAAATVAATARQLNSSCTRRRPAAPISRAPLRVVEHPAPGRR